jgi:hypothetical protein
MPIVNPDAPRSSIAALLETLPALAGSGGLRTRAPEFAASLAAPQSLQKPGLSYPVYSIGLTDLVSSAGVKKAKLSAWRHEYTSGDEVVSAEVSAGARPKFSQLNVHSRFRAVQHELMAAAEHEAFKSHSFEVRLLQISALAIRALWLRAPKSGSDILIPLAPVRHELTANRHYSAEAFVAALKPAAREILNAEGRGKGG